MFIKTIKLSLLSISGVILSLFLFPQTALAQEPPVNLFDNPSFENESIYPWDTFLYSNAGGCDYRLVEDEAGAVDGKQYIAFDRGNSLYCTGLVQIMNVTPEVGKTYRFATWVRSGSAEILRRGELMLSASGGDFQIAKQFYVADDEWQCVETSLTVEEENNTHFVLTMEFRMSLDEVEYHFDHAIFAQTDTPLCPPSDTVLEPELLNPSFEDPFGTMFWVGEVRDKCAIEVYHDSENAVDGEKYLSVHRNSDEDCLSFYQIIPFTPTLTDTYRVAIWARSPTGALRAGRLAVWSVADSVNQHIYFHHWQISGTEWQCLDLELQLEEPLPYNALTFEVYLYGEGAADSIPFEFDHAQFQIGGEPLCPNKPDLVVDSLKVTEVATGEELSPGATVVEGTALKAEVCTRNRGTRDTRNFEITYFDNGAELAIDAEGATAGTLMLPVCEEHQYQVSGVGAHTLTVEVDSGGVIDELYEDNNSASFEFWVTPPPEELPDVALRETEFLGGNAFFPGSSLSVRTRVINVAETPALTHSLSLGLSGGIGAGPAQRVVPPLAFGETSHWLYQSIQIPAHAAPGTIYQATLTADAERTLNEWARANNQQVINFTVQACDQFSFFCDVPLGHPYREEIETAYGWMTNGCNSSVDVPYKTAVFCPNEPLSRSTASVFLLRAVQGITASTNAEYVGYFADIPADYGRALWIETAFEAGLLRACGENDSGELLFCPDETVSPGLSGWLSQAELAVAVAGLLGWELTEPVRGTVFVDVQTDSLWGRAAEQMYWAGWLEPQSTCAINDPAEPGLRFCPDDVVSRGLFMGWVVQATQFEGTVVLPSPWLTYLPLVLR